MRKPLTALSAWWRRPRKRMLVIGGCVAFVLVVFHAWLHITNPYAGWNVVQQPYKTAVTNGSITIQKQFTLRAYSSSPAQLLGYYKQGFLIAQNTFIGGRPVAATTLDGIERALHRERFDPAKPYLISGDQFSVLYPRNLGVFYSSLLDPYTADGQQDWENRQRIYLQSALYALDAFASEKALTTTVVPIGPKSAVLTEVHPGSVPSDSLYGILYALDALRDQNRYPAAQYKLEAVGAVRDILEQRRSDLQLLLGIYLRQVRDPQTGLVKRGINISGARDGVLRDSSFYDNVILWKTLQLADTLGIQATPDADLTALRDKIIHIYWDDREGHFRDDQSSRPANQNYSSDWLIVLPTGFLDVADPADRMYMTRSHDFILAQGIAKPFPIKYQAQPATDRIPWAVRTFVPAYGSDVIWSYWGCEYIAMLNSLYAATHDAAYDREAVGDLEVYAHKIIDSRGFPETFAADGTVLRGGLYKSILRNGWIVDFEAARAQQVRHSLRP